MQKGWLVLVGLLAVSASATAATVNVDVGKDDPNDPAVAFLQFYPATAVVWTGDTVTWKTASHAPHTATSPPAFDSTPALRLDDPAMGAQFGPGGFLLPGQSFNTTFLRPGDFAYFCKIHPAMQGMVHVVNGTAPPSGGTAGGLPLPGTGGEANRTAAAGYVYVAAGWGSGDVTRDSFGPAAITVEPGTTVVWTNLATNEPHTVTSASPAQAFDSSPKVTGEPPWWNGPQGMMSLGGANKEFSHTFDAAGHFPYFCKIHPGMVGTVVVLQKPAANASGTGDGPGTRPNAAAGSTIPGPEPALLGLGLLGAALLARRRA